MPDFGRTAIGKTPKWALRLAEGRPEGRFRCFPGSSLAKIKPGSPISGPEALLCNIGCFWGVRQRPDPHSSWNLVMLTVFSEGSQTSEAHCQMDPEVVFWPSLFWRPGVPRQQNHTCSRNARFFGRAAEGGRAKNPPVSGKRVVFWPWYPRPPKNHLAKTTLPWLRLAGIY